MHSNVYHILKANAEQPPVQGTQAGNPDVDGKVNFWLIFSTRARKLVHDHLQ